MVSSVVIWNVFALNIKKWSKKFQPIHTGIEYDDS